MIYSVYIRIYGIYGEKLLEKKFSDAFAAYDYADNLKEFTRRIIPILKYIREKHTSFDLDLPKYIIRGNLYYEYEDLLNNRYKIVVDDIELDSDINVDWLNIGNFNVYEEEDVLLCSGSYIECKKYLQENEITDYRLEEI